MITKYNHQESLDRIRLLMKYDMSKTATENILYEQTQNNKNSFFLQNQQAGKKPTTEKGKIPNIKPDMGEIGDLGDINKVRYLKKVESPTTFEDVGKFIYDNRHGLIDIAALGAAFIPLVGPFISLGLELGNAALYASEGDKYTAGLSLAFTLIPAGQLIRRIPAVKQLGRNGLVTLLKKAKNPKLVKTLSKTETKALEEINKNSKWVMKTATTKLVISSFSKLMDKLTLRGFVKFMMKWKRNNKIKYALINTTIQLGGIYYTYNQLADMLGISEDGKDTKPKVSLQKQKQLEQSFITEKSKIKEEIEKTISNDLTDDKSLLELQKLMDNSLKQDTSSKTPIVSEPPVSSGSIDTSRRVIQPGRTSGTSGGANRPGGTSGSGTTTSIN
jgi:hypothetical protein